MFACLEPECEPTCVAGETYRRGDSCGTAGRSHLENEARAELQLTRHVRHGRSSLWIRLIDARDRIAEIHVIGHVEGFEPEL